MDSLVKGAKSSYKSPELQGYLDFILFICDSEKKYICTLNDNPSNGNRPLLNELSQHWLCLPENHFNELTGENQVQYLIAQVLLWAALFEHFLIIDQPALVKNATDHESPFTFNKYTPEINQADKLLFSVEVFLERFKNMWGKSKHFKDKISWNLLYRDIVKAIAENTPDDLEHDPENIKKQFYYWRSGKSPLTIKSFKKKIAVLYESNDDFDKLDCTQMIIPFIQLFDSIQRILIKEGLPHEYIVKQFERYPIYLDLVSLRYKQFCETKL